MEDFTSDYEYGTSNFYEINPVVWKDVSFLRGNLVVNNKNQERKFSKRPNIEEKAEHDLGKQTVELHSWDNILQALKKEKRSSQKVSKIQTQKLSMQHKDSSSQDERFTQDYKKVEVGFNNESILASKDIIRDVHPGRNTISRTETHLKITERNVKIQTKRYARRKWKKKPENNTDFIQRPVCMNTESSNSADPPRAKITIQVSSADESIFKDFMIENEKLIQVKRTFPRLHIMLPDLDPGYKRLSYSADAVILLLRHVFLPSSTWGATAIPWKVVLETFSMSKLLGMDKLQKMCIEHFSQNPISPRNMQEFCDIAHHLGVLKVFERLLKELGNLSQFQPGKRTFQRFCSVTVSIFTEPSEFKLPLHDPLPLGKNTMDSAFSRDIKNEIGIEVVSGQYCITGVQIKLNPAPEDMDKKVHIICEVSNHCEDLSFEESREKKFNDLLILNFKGKKLLVKAGQKASINITIEDLKPKCCCTGRETTYNHKNSSGTFRASLKSNMKVCDSDEKRFFIEKLFYTMK